MIFSITQFLFKRFLAANEGVLLMDILIKTFITKKKSHQDSIKIELEFRVLIFKSN